MNQWKIDFINRVEAASDIVDVVGGYLPIIRIGANWRANCPFHRDVAPTLYISPQKQAYYCFGCGAGGSVFKFVMEYERVDFDEAVNRLAERFGVPRLASYHMDAEDARSVFECDPIPGVKWEDVHLEKDAAYKRHIKAQHKVGGHHD